jgi:serine/threonine-protein kinase
LAGVEAAQAGDSLIGFVLGDKYRVLRQIGRGGMGVVYEAEHIGIGKRVAIKLMLEKYAQDGEAIARFQREAQAAGRIGNAHIIDISDIGVAPDGRGFVVMELLTGSSLKDVIAEGPMSPWRAIAIMKQVLRAVGAAHAKGIIHRDLKPDNIYLLDQGGEQREFVKLLDFGISKILDPDEQYAATRLTTTGVVMGTPLYMAPEQCSGKPGVDHRADIYSLGCVLYHLVVGKPPFERGGVGPLMLAHLSDEPERPSARTPAASRELDELVLRCMAKRPQDRFASMTEVQRACDALLAAPVVAAQISTIAPPPSAAAVPPPATAVGVPPAPPR